MPCEPDVLVCGAESRFVQVTSVPTATTSSSRVKFSMSELTVEVGGEGGALCTGVVAVAEDSGVGDNVVVGEGCVIVGD